MEAERAGEGPRRAAGRRLYVVINQVCASCPALSSRQTGLAGPSVTSRDPARRGDAWLSGLRQLTKLERVIPDSQGRTGLRSARHGDRLRSGGGGEDYSSSPSSRVIALEKIVVEL